jgi:putative ABC transport system permease protein
MLPEAAVSPLLRGSLPMGYHGFQDRTSLYGVRADYRKLWNITVQQGRFLTVQDAQKRSKVIVLGSNTARLFFPDTANPVDEAVTLGGQSFIVVGVLAPRERSAIGDGSDDDTSYIPYDTYTNFYNWTRYGGVRVLSVFFKVSNIAELDPAVFKLEQYLLTQYGHVDSQPRFLVKKAEENVNTFNKIFDIITTVISLIAAISLVVGGIGIMNIMLVAVTERTKEIGIRKAIGAKRMDILSQFLVEAVIICLIGGGVGIIFGLAVAYTVAAIQSWAYVFPLVGLALGLGVSVAIGLFFGIYPAMKASRLDPVVALTKE